MVTILFLLSMYYTFVHVWVLVHSIKYNHFYLLETNQCFCFFGFVNNDFLIYLLFHSEIHCKASRNQRRSGQECLYVSVPSPCLWVPQQVESLWGGTDSSSSYQSNHTGAHQPRFETVTSGKKKKKQKMVRADPSLLGEPPQTLDLKLDLFKQHKCSDSETTGCTHP